MEQLIQGMTQNALPAWHVFRKSEIRLEKAKNATASSNPIYCGAYNITLTINVWSQELYRQTLDPTMAAFMLLGLQGHFEKKL